MVVYLGNGCFDVGIVKEKNTFDNVYASQLDKWLLIIKLVLCNARYNMVANMGDHSFFRFATVLIFLLGFAPSFIYSMPNMSYRIAYPVVVEAYF